MEDREQIRSTSPRRPITSLRLRLQNFKLGNKYLIFEQIAHGKNSAIYYGVEDKSKLQRVFKFYNLKEIEERKGFKAKEVCKRMSNHEYGISRKCKSINILKCLDIYQDRNYKILVYQYCQKSLLDQINNREDKKVSEIRAILILKQILSALKSLNLNAKILHTCLKPQIILLCNGIYKLIDFGFPPLSAESQLENQDNLMAPQIIKKQSFNEKAQVWSIGVLFHQILYGVLPEALSPENKDRLLLAQNETIFVKTNENRMTTTIVMEFLQRCLFVNPQLRMSLLQLQNHRMFSILQHGIESKVQEKKQVFSRQQYVKNLSVAIPIAQDNCLNQELQRDQRKQLYKKRFHMDEYRKSIQKVLEQQYQRLGQSFQIQQLQKTSIAYLRSQVNRKEIQTYKQMKQLYLQCLKVEFIYHQILLPLFKSKTSKKKRQEVQLFYLILSTSFTAISRLNLLQKDKKQVFTQYQTLVESCVKKSTEILYKNVEELQKVYSALLTKIQSGIRSIFSDKVSKIFSKESLSEKDLYLTGIQAIDFDKMKKVQFTFKYFQLNKEKMVLIRQKQKEWDQSVKRAFLYLQVYIQIWSITNQNELQQKYPSLKSYIDKKVLSSIKTKPSRNQNWIQG